MTSDASPESIVAFSPAVGSFDFAHEIHVFWDPLVGPSNVFSWCDTSSGHALVSAKRQMPKEDRLG